MVSIMWDLFVYAENMRKESVGGRVTVTRIAGGGEKKQLQSPSGPFQEILKRTRDAECDAPPNYTTPSLHYCRHLLPPRKNIKKLPGAEALTDPK